MAEATKPESQPSPTVPGRKNKLSSSSLEVLTVSDSIFKHSLLLATMNTVLQSENEPFPLPSVSTNCLKLIIRFVDSNPALTLEQVRNERDPTVWGADFRAMSFLELRELLLACNYMDMPVLLHVVSRTIGEMFRDTPLETLAEIVGFKKPGKNPVIREYLNDLVVHFLPHSIDLCVDVLDFAEVWNSIVVRTDVSFTKRFCKKMYLRISVPGIPLTRGVRKLEISVDSHDQGWSSYPHNKNTRENSWTWGEVWVRSKEGEILYKDHVYRNLHASSVWELQHKTFDRYAPVLSHIKPGGNVDLMLCAEYPGWVNSTRFAEMKLYFL